MVRLELKNVSFEYPLFEVTDRSLKMSIMRRLNGATVPSICAIQNVSFRLLDGDRLGLVGRNGAGKSSLLRVLAGLAHPNQGTYHYHGRVVPLIEKGLGINPELSAADNVELPLRLLGASSNEIDQARDGIREFSELGEFFDLPVRRYSEGMKARLSFALSTSLVSDVLILDEWLSAGDRAFVQKAEKRLVDFLEQIGVVVLASHDLELLRNVCNKVLWLEKGETRMMGDADEVINAYIMSQDRGASSSAEDQAA